MGQVHGAGPSSSVDLVDLLEKGDGLGQSEFDGASLERAYVLGQTPPTEPEAGIEESPADPCVVTDGVGELDNVSPSSFTNLGHRVDKRDFRGQKRVRRHLDQLGGLEPDDQERGL